MASIFQLGISRNTKCALKDGFRKSSHILICLQSIINLSIDTMVIVLSYMVCFTHYEDKRPYIIWIHKLYIRLVCGTGYDNPKMLSYL